MNNAEIIEEVRLARDEANALANRLVDLLGRLDSPEVQEAESRRPVLAAVGGRTVEPSVYVPATPLDAIPTDDEEYVAAEEGNSGYQWSDADREDRVKEVRAARNCLIYESIYRVELTRPLPLGASTKTRVHFVETKDEAEARRTFPLKSLKRAGAGIMNVRRANEGDLSEFLEYS